MVNQDFQDAARKCLGDRPEGVSLPVYRILAATLAGMLSVDAARQGEIDGLRKRLEAVEAKTKTKAKGAAK